MALFNFHFRPKLRPFYGGCHNTICFLLNKTVDILVNYCLLTKKPLKFHIGVEMPLEKCPPETCLQRMKLPFKKFDLICI